MAGATVNTALVRRGYAAFNRGDLATLTELFAEDAVWHCGGRGASPERSGAATPASARSPRLPAARSGRNSAT